MILIDYSAVVIATILGISRGDLKNYYEDDCDLFRHALFNKLRYYNKTYHREYGKIVIAFDGDDNWRKNVFPLYKCKRKKERADSKIDWKKLFAISDVIKEDLRTLFPYKVVHVNSCEADDVIGVLAKYVNEKTMIVSNDKDFRQLLDLHNVSMYSPLAEGFVTNSQPARDVLIEHIIRGDTDDSVPNILSPDDIFITDGKRQKPITVPYVNAFQQRLRADELTTIEKANWNRNRMLIDLNCIPKDIKLAILEEYENYVVRGNRRTLMDYFINNRFKMLIPLIDEF